MTVNGRQDLTIPYYKGWRRGQLTSLPADRGLNQIDLFIYSFAVWPQGHRMPSDCYRVYVYQSWCW